ncbi:hypothetical protein [Flavimaricola marinus]|uniref:Lipoprotein n=1 Tax=Flavimaricola marinus TaxID=1819565 RepID=A0A238LDX9_9RHOB|nr:hypothetical protein [Flavimaricola marinus]SMY07792.1 hypothetical protein LOM8899_01932 [Flavimaricola marinus]
MFARRSFQRLTLVALLLAFQLSGCKPGIFAPVPYQIEVEEEPFDVRRYGFLSRGGFIEYAPVNVRRPTQLGLGLEERALAERVLAAYCNWFGFGVAPPAATYWTEDGTWHFAQGCVRPV